MSFAQPGGKEADWTFRLCLPEALVLAGCRPSCCVAVIACTSTSVTYLSAVYCQHMGPCCMLQQSVCVPLSATPWLRQPSALA